MFHKLKSSTALAHMLASPVLALALVPALGHAADAPAPAAADAPAPSEIIVTGTRTTGMRAEDSAAPIQLIGSAAIQSVGQPELSQVLAQTLPSLNIRGFGGDTANLTLTAALRGISPNDTLVLVDGKRRHFTSNLSVLSGSPYSGSATTDLSFVPVAAIGHIEVLQDGAAAQYGSDAVAGVVNIILKNTSHGATFSSSAGQYYEGDGKTASASLNVGTKLGSDGFLNLTADYKFHGFSQRGGCDYRFSTEDCALRSQFLGNVRTKPRDVVLAGFNSDPFTPRVNTINGDAQYTLYNFFFNAGLHLSDSIEFYAFGNYSDRDSKSYENYRAATVTKGVTSTGTTVYPIPTGFNPLEALREEDFSLTAGLKGDISGWHWDGSLTYGRDASSVYTLNSSNPGLYAAEQATFSTPINPQRNFYDGLLSNSEFTADLDLTHDFEVGLAKPLTFALGGEYRKGTYVTGAGEPASYLAGGPQSYPGFSTTDAGSNGRTVWAGYADIAVDPVKALHVDIAGRYEHYSEFGSVGSGKFNFRYDFSPAFAVRGTATNGFRAPTLAEEFYSSVNVGPGTAFGQFPADSDAATVLGFGKLEPEKSVNLSLGIVAHPTPSVQITIDAYSMKIKNRIVNTTAYATQGLNADNSLHVVSQAVYDALVKRNVSLADATSYSGINIFTNGADTLTHGVEATANYTSDFGDSGKVDWSLGLNYNDTQVSSIKPMPAAVFVAGVNSELLTRNQQDALTSATPRIKVIGNALYTKGKLSVNLRETLYGATSQYTSLDGSGDPSASPTLTHIAATAITDLNVGYKVTKAFRLDLGANNLLNKKAPGVPSISAGGGTYTRPADGSKVYGAPLSITPWGIDGGYYYARLTVTF